MDNQKILSYINSTDVSSYLSRIQYNFTSAEAAWLVAHCEHLTLEERHEAWKEIIGTMPDCRLESIAHHSKEGLFDSLHEVLRKVIAFDLINLSEFYHMGDNAVYQYAVTYRDDNRLDDYSDSPLYTQFERCHEAVKKIITESDEDEIQFFSIRKNYIDNPKNNIELRLNEHGNLTAVWRRNPKSKEESELQDVFDMLWFCFPAPFKKGDIVWHRNGRMESGPVVVDCLTPEHYEKTGRKGVDSSDMNIWGYFQTTSGKIYREVTFNYMDFEYYPEERLLGKKRILTALSNYIRGKIDIDLFSSAYHHILLEEYVNDTMIHWYTGEHLRLAGLAEQN